MRIGPELLRVFRATDTTEGIQFIQGVVPDENVQCCQDDTHILYLITTLHTNVLLREHFGVFHELMTVS